jgi:hypothetical protein
MVGGRIIDITRHLIRDEDNPAYRRKVFRVWCMDTRSNDECCINVEPFGLGHGPAIGDSIWWQGRKAFWTPAGNKAVGLGQGTSWDIVIDRIGYSYSPPGVRS